MDAAHRALRRLKPTDTSPNSLQKTFDKMENLFHTIELAGTKPEGEVYSSIIFKKFPEDMVLEIRKKQMKESLTLQEIRDLLKNLIFVSLILH